MGWSLGDGRGPKTIIASWHCHSYPLKLRWKVIGPSGRFPERLESFQIVWKVSRLSEKFLDCLKYFRIIWKVSRLSGKFPDGVVNFLMVR